MKVEQFVMAYQVEQDRIRALLPEEFESLRPVLRINTEIRTERFWETVYVEFNTPVAADGKRGWLNIGSWESPKNVIAYRKQGKSVTIETPFLEVNYTGTGVEGSCPAEKDNDGCFFLGEDPRFVEAETITEHKEFCDCAFSWSFSEDDASGISVGGRSVAAVPTEPKTKYEKQALSPQAAAAIECEQILGSYIVRFER